MLNLVCDTTVGGISRKKLCRRNKLRLLSIWECVGRCAQDATKLHALVWPAGDEKPVSRTTFCWTNLKQAAETLPEYGYLLRPDRLSLQQECDAQEAGRSRRRSFSTIDGHQGSDR